MSDNSPAEKKKGFLSTRFGRFVLVVGCFFALYVCVGSHNNVITWVKARNEITRIEKQKAALEKEIVEMDENIRMLTSDRDTLEKVAREKLGFAAPDEDVYVIEK